MADERCVTPGDGSRAPGRWLDRDAADRLLRGEPLDTLDGEDRDQADRLAEALGALSASAGGTAPNSTELPGEAAALAAFRSVRAGRDAVEAGSRPSARALPAAPSSSPDTSLDAGLIHLGRAAAERRTPFPRWIRPVRHALAAVLAAGMLGGVALATTTGVPAFGGGDEPEPGASATVTVGPDRPLRTPPPDRAPGSLDGPRPGSSTGAPAGGGSVPRDEAGGDTGTGPGARPGSGGEERGNRPAQRWTGLASACRDHRDGKDLDPGRRRTLEDAAHGAGQVRKYCEGVLGNRDHRGNTDQGGNGKDGNGKDGNGKDGNGKGSNGRSGDEDGGRDGRDGRDGGHHGGGQDRDAGSGSGSGTGTGSGSGGNGGGGNAGGRGHAGPGAFRNGEGAAGRGDAAPSASSSHV